MATDLAFVHRFVPAAAPGPAPLLLLHGTGGDEADLVPLGQALLPGAALLSPRGRVLEHGMPRFFARFGEGVFDPAEVRARTGELAAFVAEARIAYDLPAPIAVGFSNGANIAALLLALHPGTLAGAVLLRPMRVLAEAGVAGGPAPVLILSGAADPIVPMASAEALATQLRGGGAVVEHAVVQAGHGLTEADVTQASAWLRRRAAGGA